MIEIFHYFKKKHQQYGDRFVFDKITLPYGIYIKVEKDGSIKDENILLVNSNEKNDYPLELYNWFMDRDFHSRIIYDDTNKSIDTAFKKIHSINPYALILKRLSLPDMIIDPKIKPSKTIERLIKEGLSSLEIYKHVLNQHYIKLRAAYDTEIDYDSFKEIFINHTENLITLCDKRKMKGSQRVKIFYDECLEKYKTFYNKHMEDKVFCSNNYNVEIDNKTYGVPAYNNTLNSDKPSLRMSSTSFDAPWRVTIEDAILFYKMSFIVKQLKEEMNIEFVADTSGDIQKFDNLVDINNKSYLYKSFKILQIESPNDIITEGEEKQLTRGDIEWILSKNFLGGLLKEFYKIETGKDVSNTLKEFNKVSRNISLFNELAMKKTVLHSYFRKNEDAPIANVIYKVTNMVLEDYIRLLDESDIIKDFYKLREIWDVQTSLLNYFFEGSDYGKMANIIKDLHIQMKQELFESDDLFVIKNDETFYFLLGQLAHYFIGKSGAQQKRGNLLTPFLKSKTSSKLKDELIKTYDKYSHEISLYADNPANKAFQGIMSYVPTRELKDRSLNHLYHGALVGTNVFYTKMKKEEDKKEEN